MKIILTGSSGFVGKNLSAYLKDNRSEVLGLFLREEDWINKIDCNATAIIHLAGKAHDISNTSSIQEYFKVNRDLTIELFDKFLETEIKDFFYFSSVKAVADRVEDILTEEYIANPVTPYGKSKLEAEKYLLSKALPEGKRLFIIRPCMIHGSGNKGNLNLLYKLVEIGIPWPLASFENRRSFLSIDNLNFLINQMLTNQNVASGVYNFSDDDAVSTNQLITLISETIGRKSKLWYINRKLVEKTAVLGDKFRLPLNSERLKKLTENYVVSNDKIKTALGIDKLSLVAEEGLRKTIESFKR